MIKNMFKKLLLFFISLFIGIILLVWIIHFIGWQEIKSAFLIFTGWHGIIILLLTALMLFLGMWKWKVILKSQGYDLPLQKLTNSYLAGFSLAYLFPLLVFGGEIFKGYILKENFSIPWKNGMTSTIIDKIMEATSFLITIFAGLIFFLLKIGLPPQNIGIILGGGLLVVSCAIGLFYFKVFKKESMVKLFAKLFNHRKLLNVEVLEAEKEIFTFFKSRKRALFVASLLAFARVAVTWLRCWVLIIFLGESVAPLSALAILGFYYFVFMIPIPMALGSHEVIQTFAFGALGLGAGAAPAFTMIQRAAELFLALMGMVIFFRFGVDLLKTLIFRKLETIIKENNNHP